MIPVGTASLSMIVTNAQFHAGPGAPINIVSQSAVFDRCLVSLF
jgi:hypothetical protein